MSEATIAAATEHGTTLYIVTEFLGYAGGVVLAVALFPQVVHTCKTKSTADISFGWQCTYIVGLVMNYVYFVLIGATAAWVTLTVELLFACVLFVLKVKYDGLMCSSTVKSSKTGSGVRNSESMDPTEFMASSDSTIEFDTEGGDVKNFGFK